MPFLVYAACKTVKTSTVELELLSKQALSKIRICCTSQVNGQKALELTFGLSE